MIEALKRLVLFKANKLKGGKADNLSLSDIAKKHGMLLASIKKEYKMGMKVEAEHTDDPEKQSEIAMDHLFENGRYYSIAKKAGLADELEETKKSLKAPKLIVMVKAASKEAMNHSDTLGAGAKKRKKLKKKQDKFDTVMAEFAKGTLHSSDGKIVTDKDQALAIAYSESERHPFKKSKTFSEGTVREYNGISYIKQNGQWKRKAKNATSTLNTEKRLKAIRADIQAIYQIASSKPLSDSLRDRLKRLRKVESKLKKRLKIH